MEDERNYTVYMHVCPNGKKYIGITCQDVFNRWGKNGNGYKNQPFFNSIKSHGWNNIEHKILLKNLTKEEAQFKEIEYIQKYKTLFPNGWNFTEGGESEIPSGETKRKISISMRNVWNNYSKEKIELIKNKISTKMLEDDNHQSRKIVCENYLFNTVNDFKKCYGLTHNIRRYFNEGNSLPIKWQEKCLRYFNENIDNEIDFILYNKVNTLNSTIVIYNNKEYKTPMELSNKININYNTLIHYLNGDVSTPIEIYKNGLKYKYKENKTYCREDVKGKRVKIICDNTIFISISILKRKENNIGCSHLSEYLFGSRPMPQKWIDRGLRYYNPDTDKDLPIYQPNDDGKEEDNEISQNKNHTI